MDVSARAEFLRAEEERSKVIVVDDELPADASEEEKAERARYLAHQAEQRRRFSGREIVYGDELAPEDEPLEHVERFNPDEQEPEDEEADWGDSASLVTINLKRNTWMTL